jgi:release factor glutamine methyltransferase
MDLKTTLKWATLELDNTHDTAKLDSEVLLAHTLKKDRSYLYTWPENELTSEQVQNFKTLIEKRKSGNPIAYLLGNKEFWSLNFKVTPDILIPRPETELLVEQALKLIPKNKSWEIADLGTGSGAIALAIASECQHCQITATDKYLQVVQLANSNAIANNLKNVTFIKSKWFESLAGQQFNMIVSNPPYVSNNDPLLSQGDVRFEPTTALKSGIDGLDDIRIIIQNANTYLFNDGWLLLEHGFEQHEQVQQILHDSNYKNITTINDLSGHPRVTLAQI